jgi:hypothetical protein
MTIQTRFANCPRWVPPLVLALLALLIALGAAQSAPVLSGPFISEPVLAGGAEKPADVMLYKAIVASMQSGAGYYPAAAQAQRAGHYPLWPPQVIREPTEAVLLKLLRSDLAARALLLFLAVAATEALRRALAASNLSSRESLWAWALGAIGIADALSANAIFMHEIWAAQFILLSLALRRDTRWGWSVIAGLLACAFRETALPFLFVMGAFAAFERRWREAAGWTASIAVFGALLALHLGFAAAQHHPGDLVSPGWAAFGGLGFILATMRSNALFVLLPNAVLAAALGAALLGLAGARDRLIGRVLGVLATYFALFSVVGRPDNDYWGYLYAPLLPIGLALAPRALADLARTTKRSRLRGSAPAPLTSPGS